VLAGRSERESRVSRWKWKWTCVGVKVKYVSESEVKVEVEVEEGSCSQQHRQTASKQARFELAVGGSGTTFTDASQREREGPPAQREKRSLRHTEQGASGDGGFAAWPG